jgi:RIO kinase 1
VSSPIEPQLDWDNLTYVDLASNPHAMEFLQRDCANMAHWFTSRGFRVDEGELFADLLGYAW